MQNFDEVINRKNTNCVKFDAVKRFFKKDDIQPLWVADMDFRTPKFIVKSIQQKVNEELYGYPEPHISVFNSIKDWMKNRHQWEITTNDILLLSGVVAGLSAAVEAFSEEKDEVIIQTPVYYPFYSVIKHNNRNIIENPLINDNGYYKMDIEDFKSKITSKTKLLILCSPHNPVGRVWNKEELKTIADICVQNNIKIISDEIHSDIVYKKFTPLASISNEISNITLTLNSPSKTFNLAGLNSSYAVCSNKDMLHNYKKIVRKREIGSLNIFGLVALQSAYESGENWVEKLLFYLKSNIQFVQEFFKDNDMKVDFKNPESTYLLWLNFERYNFTHEEIRNKLLNDAKVGLNDGVSFGKSSNLYFRINIALPKNQLKIALEKIRDNLKTI
jgi:cystathionine beta-lyase